MPNLVKCPNSIIGKHILRNTSSRPLAKLDADLKNIEGNKHIKMQVDRMVALAQVSYLKNNNSIDVMIKKKDKSDIIPILDKTTDSELKFQNYRDTFKQSIINAINLKKT